MSYLVLYEKEDLEQEVYLYTLSDNYKRKMRKYDSSRGRRESLHYKVTHNYVCDIIEKEMNRMKRFVNNIDGLMAEETISEKLEEEELHEFINERITSEWSRMLWDILIETPVDYVKLNNNSKFNSVNVARYFHISVPMASKYIREMIKEIMHILEEWRTINV